MKKKKKKLEDQRGFVWMSPSWKKNNEVLYAMLHGEDYILKDMSPARPVL